MISSLKDKSIKRIKIIMGHFFNIWKDKETICDNCSYKGNSDIDIDIEDIIKAPRYKSKNILCQLKKRKKGYGLPGNFFTAEDIYEAELDNIFYKEWIFVGHTIELKEIGSWLTIDIGKYPVFVVRDDNYELKAYHNICRHRGLKICNELNGKFKSKNIVCQYHNWSYDKQTGKLKYARAMEDNKNNFNQSELGLFPVKLESVGGYIFVCVSDNPPNFEEFKNIIEEYSEPYNLNNCKIAYKLKIIEKCNWKLTWENNRECYHCLTNHPELIQSFPGNWIQTKDGDFKDTVKQQNMEDLRLPYKFISSEDNQYRIMRHFFVKGSTSMTMTGEPAIKNGKTLGRIPNNEDIGNVALYHYPTTWNHWQADYAISFRMVPINSQETELVTTWIVPNDAEEGIDYDLDELTKVWIATNEQDKYLVEKVQMGIKSPAYKPGPLNEIHEGGVIEFVDWYSNLMINRLISI
jgi:glycine betaine catabolism A